MNIISAIHPRRDEDDYTAIYLTVWFEEHPDCSFEFVASIFDCEPHGRELWFRAMKGEYGEIEVLPKPTVQIEAIKMLTYEPEGSRA